MGRKKCIQILRDYEHIKRLWVFTFASACFSTSPVLLKGYVLLQLEQAFKNDLVHLFYHGKTHTHVLIYSRPVFYLCNPNR